MAAEYLTNLQMDSMQKVNIYPSPFESKLSLEIISDRNENAIVSLLDQQQKIIRMFSWYLKTGTNKTSLDDLGALPAANYYINIRNAQGEVTYDALLKKE